MQKEHIYISTISTLYDSTERAYVHTKMCILTFIMPLFIASQIWKKFQKANVNNKFWCVHIRNAASWGKGNKFLIYGRQKYILNHCIEQKDLSYKEFILLDSIFIKFYKNWMPPVTKLSSWERVIARFLRRTKQTLECI